MRKKTSNKKKQILALVLSAVMLVGTVNASGMTTYAEEGSVTEETHSNHGNCGVIGCTDEIHSDNENHSIEAIEWTVLDQETLNTYIVDERYYNLPDGNYYLTEDITLSYWIAIYGNVNLCLNGKSISGNNTSNNIFVYEGATLNLCDCKENGTITKVNGDAGVRCNGTFNMYGGNITDNINTYYGGGVYVADGTFNMYGGSITNNKVTGITGQGGGVCLLSLGNSLGNNFTMYGGKIANNTSAQYGGGVYITKSTFTMSGGSITDNDAPKGAGVYMSYDNDTYLNLSGTPVINNNKNGGNLYKDDLSGTITITDKLKEGASIGVTWKDYNSKNLTGDFAVAGENYTLTDSDKEKFHSDNSSYVIGLRNNTLALGTSIESATVALNQENYVYDGAPCEPNVTVSLGDETLTKDTDYTVSYSNNQNAGTATVTINGAGDYVGTITKNFTITKADNAPNMPEREINVSYNHKTVSDVTTLPQGWTWKDSDKTVELKVGEVVKATAVYTEDDKANYETVEVIVSITRSACKHELSKKDKVEPTSEKAGQKEYWFCSICEKKFADAEGKTEITNEKDLVIPALENTEDQNKTSDAPAAGTVLTDTKTKATYKIVTSDTKKGTVAYVQPTSKKKKTVTIPATVTLDGITYRVTKVADDAFKNNKYLTKITIGNNITEIGKSAFQGCKKLKTVNLGKNVTTIGNKAFYKCTALTKITIPSKVKKIGKQAFYGCKNLKNITIKTKKLTTKNVGSKAFKGIHKKAVIKVPKSKVKAYTTLLKKKGIGKAVKVKKLK